MTDLIDRPKLFAHVRGARRIINGTDHAALIAQTARDFYDGMDYVS